MSVLTAVIPCRGFLFRFEAGREFDSRPGPHSRLVLCPYVPVLLLLMGRGPLLSAAALSAGL